MKMNHVLWLGGGCGAGKSTLATALAHRFDLRLYRVDVFAYPHDARKDPRRHPVMCSQAELDYMARHVDPSPADLAKAFIDYSVERFEMILADLADLAPSPPVLVEGPSLLPELVSAVVASPDQAMWLLPTTEFTDTNLRRRDEARPVGGATEQRAHRKRVARDALLTERMRADAARLGLPGIEVDGSLTLAQTEQVLAEHFALAMARSAGIRGGSERSRMRRIENAQINAAVAAHRKYLADKAPAELPVLTYACECEVSGCRAQVELTPQQYAESSPVVAHQ